MDEGVRQYADEVTDFSSQYGSEISISYTVSNITGASTIYPNYGDYTQAAVLRSYGNWWHKSPSATLPMHRTPQSFISEDFIELHFDKKVYPTAIQIYETYNGGAVVRILACNTSLQRVRWCVLWSGEPQRLPAKSRIFEPALLCSCDFPTDIIRLEFNQSLVNYYTELDAVCLIGYCTPPSYCRANGISCLSSCDVIDPILHNHLNDLGLPPVQLSIRSNLTPTEILMRNFMHLHVQDGLTAALDVSDNGYFDLLPDEVIQVIVGYLDVESLCRLSTTCRLFYKHCYDSMQYLELNLQPYWHKICDSSLDGLKSRCRRIQQLSFSWCGPYDLVTVSTFNSFMKMCGKELTCLRLACCRFIDGSAISAISNFCINLEELDLQSCRKVDSPWFRYIAKLTRLKWLNLYRTVVDVVSITAILRSCTYLEHLNLGSCNAISEFDDVAAEIASCKNMKTLDLWRAQGLSDVGMRRISANCHYLEGLDVGWCNDLRSGTGCFTHLVRNCPRLRKLFLTANRTICDGDIDAIARHCPSMEQLDILGTREVSSKSILSVLEKCPHLKFLDLSFCGGIDSASIATWKERYPLVDIKRSFQLPSY